MSQQPGTLHIIRDGSRTDGLAGALVRREAGAGRWPTVLCIHDAVAWGLRRSARIMTADSLPLPGRLLVSADDCRRRGLTAPADVAVSYTEIVELITASPRVICW